MSQATIFPRGGAAGPPGPAAAGRLFGVTVDGAGAVLTTGQKGYITIPFTGTIAGWYIVADQSGSIVMDVWKKASPTIPVNADSITGSEKPTLSAAQFASDVALTTWTTNVTAGDIIGFEIESVSTITRVNLVVFFA
jgi:hypothetical protein